MVPRRVGSLLRVAVSLAGLSTGSVVAAAVLAWATRWILMDSGSEAGFDVWVGRVAACGAWLAVLWLTLGFTISVIAAVRGSAGDLWTHLATRIAPTGVRRAACFAAGSLLMSGAVAATGGPAVAGSLSPPTPVVSELPDLDRPFLPRTATNEEGATTLPRQDCSRRNVPSTGESAAAWTPTMPDSPASPSARQPRLPGAHPADAMDQPTPQFVTVAAGDTLWDIAGDHLGHDATTADIAAAWPAWFVANRQVIGDDPDLIFPGERLAPP